METSLGNPKEDTENRRNIYRLLASIYQKEPTVDILKEMKTSALLNALSKAGYSLDDLVKAEDLKGAVSELECEFARLFLGPGPHISPHQSVYSLNGTGKGLLWGEITSEVKKFIEYCGLNFSQDFRGIPDHLSIELGFMGRLIDKELELRSKNDHENVVHCLKVEKHFLQKHLLNWVPKFCEDVIAKAELSFYKEISKFLKDFINSENDFFSKNEIGGNKMT